MILSLLYRSKKFSTTVRESCVNYNALDLVHCWFRFSCWCHKHEVLSDECKNGISFTSRKSCNKSLPLMSTILINICRKFVLSQWWNTSAVGANWHEIILSENWLQFSYYACLMSTRLCCSRKYIQIQWTHRQKIFKMFVDGPKWKEKESSSSTG